MRLDKARIAPMTDEELNSDQEAIMAPMLAMGRDYNIFRTMLRDEKAFQSFLVWANYVLSDRHNSLSPRDRELIILRTGFNCKAGYEWAQHVRIGEDKGLTSEEIERIKAGPEAPEWNAVDRALLHATDELTEDKFVAQSTWEALAPLGDAQRMDLVYTVGQYTLVSMALNSFGVQLDDDLTLDPDLVR